MRWFPLQTILNFLHHHHGLIDGYDVNLYQIIVLDPATSQEPLGELVPSQWGLVHLFDLCLWFGHIDTALALANGGVKGCSLEDHHLGALPDASDVEQREFRWCGCNGSERCSTCCWAFPFENGVWMKDWDAPLDDASGAAWEAAKMPLVRGILDISCCNDPLPFAMSEAAAARLLDIAILWGNVEAAANLAKTHQARPLRRWCGKEIYSFAALWDEDLAEWNPTFSAATFSAALCAGADFEGVHTDVCGSTYAESIDVPLLRVLPLHFEPEDWQHLEQVFPSEKNQWPSRDVKVGELFLTREYGEDVLRSVSVQRVQNALRAGWDLKYIWMEFDAAGRWYAAGLLDVAVLCGQQECASALGSAGVELREDCLDLHRLAFPRDGLEALRGGPNCLSARVSFGSASECKCAASAAAHAFLMNSFKREGVEKGIALYQTLAKKFHPRGVPLALVHDILSFSMEAPKILDQLDLWDEVSGWMPSVQIDTDGDDKASLVEDSEVEEQQGSEIAQEPGTLSICQVFLFPFGKKTSEILRNRYIEFIAASRHLGL